MIEVTIFTDIETLPTDDPVLIAAIAESIVPPKSMKKAETIAAWEATEKLVLILEAIAKTSLDGGLGRCACIGFGVANEPILSEAAVEDDGRHTEAAERWMIEGYFAACEAVYVQYGVPPIIAGHNVTGFDVRWLWKRAIVLGITVPWWWPHGLEGGQGDRGLRSGDAEPVREAGDRGGEGVVIKDTVLPTEAELEKRGVIWPVCGFAPRLYYGRCRKCEEVFMGAKRSVYCLPCAISLSIEASRIGRAEIDQARQDGRQSVLNDVRRLVERPSRSVVMSVVEPGRAS